MTGGGELDIISSYKRLREEGLGGEALKLLVEVAEGGNADAAHELGAAHENGAPDLGLQGRDLSLAIRYHHTAAAKGNPASQHVMAVVLATGVLSEEPDEPKAIIHELFAAMGGDPEAQAALGYRFYHGHGVPQSCDTALRYYEAAAAASVADAQRRGVPPPHERARLSEVAAQGRRAQKHADAEVVQYYEHTSARGDAAATRTLGHMHLHGMRGLPQDLDAAARLFRSAADAGDLSAAGALGQLLLHGPPGRRDVAEALRLFRASESDPQSLTGLGYMSMKGVGGVPKDVEAAIAYFDQAMKSGGHADALFNVGLMLYEGKDPLQVVAEAEHVVAADQSSAEGMLVEGGGGSGSGNVAKGGVVLKDLPSAFKYFAQAAANSHLEGTFRLGQMSARGEGTPRSCPIAVTHFKTVAERGPWGSRLMRAYRDWQLGDTEAAIWEYLRAAEAGSEVAQSNAALLLDSGVCLGMSPQRCERLALRMYRRAARQGRPEAHVAVGDFRYYGRGGLSPDAGTASRSYVLAADSRHPQALFNLGAMYQLGDGVRQDLHLAKRYYDMAMEASPDASVPVRLALWSLRLQSASHSWGSFGRGMRRMGRAIIKPSAAPAGIVLVHGSNSTAAESSAAAQKNIWSPRTWLGAGGGGGARVSLALQGEDAVLAILVAALAVLLTIMTRLRQRGRRPAPVAAATGSDASTAAAADGDGI